MAWKEVSIEELAKSLGANVAEIREKQRVVGLIVKTRRGKKLSQADLAKKLKFRQARIAQIESGVGTAKVTFDVLFNILDTGRFGVRLSSGNEKSCLTSALKPSNDI